MYSATCYRQQHMTEQHFDAALDRIMDHYGVRTQIQLADIFGIKQSSISDAKRRRSIPASWLVILTSRERLEVDWILHGTGNKFVSEPRPSDIGAGGLPRVAPIDLLRLLAYHMKLQVTIKEYTPDDEYDANTV